MLLRVSDHTAPSWNRLVETFGDRNLLQTWEWGEAKHRTAPWSVERLEFVESGEIVGIAQVLVRRLPLLLGGMAWVNRGPLWDRNSGDEHVPAMMRLLHERYVGERGLYLRVAPTLPDSRLPGILLGAARFQNAGLPGHQAGRIDLTRSETALRAGLRQSWRRFLVKAERQGTQVIIGRDPEIFTRFLDAYGTILDQAAYRKSTTPDLLQAFQDALPEGSRMIVLEAVAGKKPVSWVLIATYGETGEYLAAASLPDGRQRNCGQLLTWAAMLHLKALDFRTLDIGGFDPHDEASGVSHFKRGTNAVAYRYCTEIDAHSSVMKRSVIRRAIALGRTPIRIPLLAPGRAGFPTSAARDG